MKKVVNFLLIFLGFRKLDRKIHLLVGGSGSGKTRIGDSLKELGVPEVVSHTTREMRVGEKNGVTYYFVKRDVFNSIEKIESTEYAGNFYGLSKKEVDKKLKYYGSIFAITDMVGVHQIKAQYPNETTSIFIYTSIEEMENRMITRGDDKKSIQNRIKHAIENEELENFIYTDYVVFNDDFAKAMERIIDIVFREKDNLEIERKFLVKYPPSPWASIKHKKELTQAYLNTVKEVRIRREDSNYYKTEKSDGDLIREEITTSIDSRQFANYLELIKGEIIEKTRYYILTGNHVAELDLYKNGLEGLITVEVEFLSQKDSKEFIPPVWFGEEVTFDKRYKNKNLSFIGRP